MSLSFVSAITYLIVMTLTLSKNDLAHGQLPFADPMVLPIMAIFALISGLAGWPFFAVFGRKVQPATVAKVTWIIVPGFIIVATPFDPAFGWPGSYVVCILALIFCAIRFRNRHGEDVPPNHSFSSSQISSATGWLAPTPTSTPPFPQCTTGRKTSISQTTEP